jgi:deoxyribonuclease V
VTGAPGRCRGPARSERALPPDPRVWFHLRAVPLRPSPGGLPRLEPHAWDLTTAQAASLQRRLAREWGTWPQLSLEDLGEPLLVGGLDAAYRGGKVIGSCAVLEVPGFRRVATASAERAVSFPYVPGLLSFREAPVLLDCLEALPVRPDCLLVDGAGRAHPRRFGLACHLGALAGIPTVGVAKSRLVGQEPRERREGGTWVPLLHEGEVVGAVVWTRSGARPLYVSQGYGLGLEDCVRLVLRCTGRYRLPEPLRLAHGGAERRAREAAQG